MDYVFGYGSLAALALPGDRAVRLLGHRRRWGVAMDNREAIPGYKRYVDPDGAHPAVHVAFLDLVADAASAAVNGVCRPITAAQLARLDRRERNYVRRDVTTHVANPPGRVFAYVGSHAGRHRLRAARTAGTAVVARAYRDAVLAAFAQRGIAELAHFHASTELGGLPVRDLRRVDLSH